MPKIEPFGTRTPVANDAVLYSRLKKTTFPWSTDPNETEIARDLFGKMAAQPGRSRAAFLIAERAGRFLGYSSAQPFAPFIDGNDVISPDTPIGVLTQAAVVPNERGAGIGTALVERLIAPLADAGFSIVMAQIKPELGRWYERMGWTVLPDNCGFAWIEEPSILNLRLLPPGAPADFVASHTPLLFQKPMQEHGYTTIAFKLTGAPMRAIAASYFPVSSNTAEDGRRAAQSLIEALEADPQARAKVPKASAILLGASALSEEESRALGEELQSRSAELAQD